MPITQDARSEEKRSAEWRLIEQRYGKEMDELLCEALAAGKSLKQIAREWNASPLTIQAWARICGYRLRWVGPSGRALR